MEVRIDYLKGERILYSTKRGKRPSQYKFDNQSNEPQKFDCPFCKDVAQSAGELICENAFGSRIIENKYPILDNEYGVHDVAIESYEHDLQFKDMSVELVQGFLKMLQDRQRQLENLDGIEYVQIFKNSGSKSGASIKHHHWQILATKYLPNKVNTIKNKFTEYYSENGTCYLCNQDDFIKLYEDDFVVMGLPKASIAGKFFRIFTKRHLSSFLELDYLELRSISDMLIKSIQILDKLEKGASYNFVFFTKPLKHKSNDFHFFVEVIERNGNLGGFELSSGDYVNSTLPEDIYNEIKNLTEV